MKGDARKSVFMSRGHSISENGAGMQLWSGAMVDIYCHAKEAIRRHISFSI